MPPLRDVLEASTLVFNLTPFPSQLFSITLKTKLPPLVPMPAPAEISPVACSSTLISIILELV